MKPVNRKPGHTRKDTKPGFPQKKDDCRLHDKQKESMNPPQNQPSPYAYFGYTMMLHDRPRPLLRILEVSEDACHAVGDFFSRVSGYVSLIYHLIRHPESFRNTLMFTYPWAAQKQETPTKTPGTRPKTGNREPDTEH